VPLTDTADVGAKITVNFTLCFGERVIGKLSPLAEKPWPLMFAAEIVTADAPALVNVSERLVLLLVCTLPKESLDDDAARVEAPLEPTGANPWQLVSSTIPAAIKSDGKKGRHDRRTCNGSNS
jgi:hypothetical protein